MSRPEALNAMDPEMIRDLVEVLAQLKEDAEARAVVITGAGRAFCAGGDVKVQQKFLDQPFVARTERLTQSQWISRHINSMEKPVIAAVNGPAVGAGGDELQMAGMIVAFAKRHNAL